MSEGLRNEAGTRHDGAASTSGPSFVGPARGLPDPRDGGNLGRVALPVAAVGLSGERALERGPIGRRPVRRQHELDRELEQRP